MAEKRAEPSEEVKAVIREFVRVQRERYGENWKDVLAAEMAAKTAPVVDMLLKLKKVRSRR